MQLDRFTIHDAHLSHLGIGGWSVSIAPADQPRVNVARRVHARVVDPEGDVVESSFEPVVTPAGRWRVCPGRVRLLTSQDGEWEYFCSGGEIETRLDGERLDCSLRSSAPILPLSSERETLADQLAEEMALRIAEARAGADDLNDFDRRLAALEPMGFYTALLADILDDYRDKPDLRRVFHALDAAARQERETLRGAGHWPASPLDWRTVVGT